MIRAVNIRRFNRFEEIHPEVRDKLDKIMEAFRR